MSQSKPDLLSSSVLSKSSCMHLSNVIPGIIEPCTAVLSIRSLFCKLQRLSDWSRHLQAAYPFIPAVSVKDCCQTLTQLLLTQLFQSLRSTEYGLAPAVSHKHSCHPCLLAHTQACGLCGILVETLHSQHTGHRVWSGNRGRWHDGTGSVQVVGPRLQ